VSVFDIKDQAVLTEIVRRDIERAYEKGPRLGDLIAPLKPVQDRVVKTETIEYRAFGKGQFKAPDATPALYTPRIKYTEEGIELALLEEMTVIQESHWHRLNSADESIRRAAGVDILGRAKVLQLRNERLTEWMRFEAFKGKLIIEYPVTGMVVELDYKMPATHKPVASIAWTAEGSTPVDDIRAWQKLSANTVGHHGVMIHLNSDTWEVLERHVQVRDYLTDGSRDLFLPTEDEVARLMRAGTQFVVHDGGFTEEDSEYEEGLDSLTQYIPDGYVLITTPYVIDGEQIADTPDGLVAISTAYDELSLRQGMQSEVIVNHEAKAHFWRQASARIPRVKRPGAFVWAKVF